MLGETIFLQSYGIIGGQFGNLLRQWEQMGVFSYLLPFLLIFALVYGILSKLNLFGDESNKSINAIIALAVGLMSLQFGFVSVFFADILPKLGVALAGILVLLILIGLFGNPKDKAFMNALMWGSFGVAILVVLMSLDIFESGRTGDYFLRFIPVDWIPWIALIVLIVIIVVSSTSKSETTPGGHLLKALGGETIK